MSMQHCIEDIRPWMLTDRLKLNVDKTEYLLIGIRLQLFKISAGSLAFGYYQITSPKGPRIWAAGLINNIVWGDKSIRFVIHLISTSTTLNA